MSNGPIHKGAAVSDRLQLLRFKNPGNEYTYQRSWTGLRRRELAAGSHHMGLREHPVLLVDKNHGRLVDACLLVAHRCIADDDHLVSDRALARGCSIQADHAAAGL